MSAHGGAVLDVDAHAFAAAVGAEPLALAHALDPELFSAPAIERLAQVLPPAWATYHDARLPDLMPSSGAPPVEGSAAEVVAALDDLCASVRLYHLQHREPYRSVVHRCLDEVYAIAGTRDGGMRQRDASLFISSPGAVVPAHFDRHHNILLQVTGSKDVYVGAYADPSLGHTEIETRAGTGRNHVAHLPERTRIFHLEPGDGVYLPPYTFHWVHGLEGVSTALSCSFTTARSERTELVNRCNRRLRALGIRPAPAGVSAARDAAKAVTVSSWRRLSRRLARSTTEGAAAPEAVSPERAAAPEAVSAEGAAAPEAVSAEGAAAPEAVSPEAVTPGR